MAWSRALTRSQGNMLAGTVTLSGTGRESGSYASRHCYAIRHCHGSMLAGRPPRECCTVLYHAIHIFTNRLHNDMHLDTIVYDNATHTILRRSG
jgi:hypothetical protein